MKDFIKCVKAVIPRGANAIFSETTNGHLIYEQIELDVDRGWWGESGHVSPSFGDSGSPFWTMRKFVNDGKTYEKAEIIALLTGMFRRGGEAELLGEYVDDVHYQCRLSAIKITKDMLRWLYETEKRVIKTPLLPLDK